MLVSKRPWTSWQEIQEAHHVYMASPGPWSLEAAVDYLHDEHPQSFSSSAAQIAALMAGALDTTVLQPELLRLAARVPGRKNSWREIPPVDRAAPQGRPALDSQGREPHVRHEHGRTHGDLRTFSPGTHEPQWRLRRLGSSVCGNGARILSQQSRNWPVIRREPGRSSASARTAAVVPWHCFRRSCCHRSASARQSKGLASRGLQVAFEVAADGAAAAVDHLAASIVSSPTVTPRSIPSPAPASASETVPLVNTWAELDLMRPA